MSAVSALFISATELRKHLERGEPATILDIRGEKHWLASDEKLPGALRVPLACWRIDPAWPRDRFTVLYCSCPGDVSSLRAAERLREVGFSQAYALQGGFEAWRQAGGACEPRDR